MITANIHIGQVFKYDDYFLKCVTSGETGCLNCTLEPNCARGKEPSTYEPYHMACFAKYRVDNTSVKFIKVKTAK